MEINIRFYINLGLILIYTYSSLFSRSKNLSYLSQLCIKKGILILMQSLHSILKLDLVIWNFVEGGLQYVTDMYYT